MRLPRQTQVFHRLEFTPAEKYFYDQRSKYWINEFKGSIENIERDQQISTLSNSVSMTSNYQFTTTTPAMLKLKVCPKFIVSQILWT